MYYCNTDTHIITNAWDLKCLSALCDRTISAVNVNLFNFSWSSVFSPPDPTKLTLSIIIINRFSSMNMR